MKDVIEKKWDKNYKTLNNRREGAILSLLLVAAILMSWTLAWQSFSQQAINQSKGEPGPAGGRLHDDFEVIGPNYGQGMWRNGLTANKDIYIENYESIINGRDIFVRIKLLEYMEIGPGATLLPSDPGYGARTAAPLIAGADRDDASTWSPRVPGADLASDQFRTRWNWTMGGQKDYMPTFNKDNHSKETDIKGDAVDRNGLAPGEVMNETKPGGTNAYSADAGLHDYFSTAPNDTYSAYEKYWDDIFEVHEVGTSYEIHTARPTEDGTVITMAQWKAAPYDSKPGKYWVADTDGWCYWASPLSPDTATGLLLNSITLMNEPDYAWYYGISVKTQMATAGDWADDSPGSGFYADPAEQPTPDAETLMYIITGRRL